LTLNFLISCGGRDDFSTINRNASAANLFQIRPATFSPLSIQDLWGNPLFGVRNVKGQRRSLCVHDWFGVSLQIVRLCFITLTVTPELTNTHTHTTTVRCLACVTLWQYCPSLTPVLLICRSVQQIQRDNVLYWTEPNGKTIYELQSN